MRGVTAYIREELVADGVGRARVPRPGGQRNGLQVGQRVDNAVYQHVANGKPLRNAGGVAVMQALRARGLVAITAQTRANNRNLLLTTQLDLICARISDCSLWVIEIKSTTLNKESHLKSYKHLCSRTPYLRNSLPHSECTTHLLQTAFGAMALEQTYANLPPAQGLLVVVTKAPKCEVVTYEVPPNLCQWHYFERRTPVPIKRPLSTLKKTMELRPSGAPRLAWPSGKQAAKVDAVLAGMGLRRKKKGAPKKGSVVNPVVRARGTDTQTVAVVICVPKRIAKLSVELQRRAMQSLQTASVRERRKLGPGASVSQLWLALDTMMVSSATAA